MMEPNCLGVQLAKFFIENAMVLEEMCLDDGSQKMCEHVNPSISKEETYKQLCSPTAPLKRQTRCIRSIPAGVDFLTSIILVHF